jgi:hypothetical protein
MVDLAEPELRQEILKLRRRVQKLSVLLRIVLALLQASGFTLSRERLPDGRAKKRILRAIDQAARASRCGHSYSSSGCRQAGSMPGASGRPRVRSTITRPCPRTASHHLTAAEVRRSRPWWTAPECRHVPTGTLAVLAQRLGDSSGGYFSGSGGNRAVTRQPPRKNARECGRWG